MAIAVSLTDYYTVILKVNRMFWIMPYSKPQTESLHIIQRCYETSICPLITVSLVKSKNHHKLKPQVTPDQSSTFKINLSDTFPPSQLASTLKLPKCENCI